jgi:hypothetical protein
MAAHELVPQLGTIDEHKRIETPRGCRETVGAASASRQTMQSSLPAPQRRPSSA